jgi:hypothetical protein
MTRPEEALERAREAAERKRGEGVYPEPGPGALEESITAERPDLDLVAEWAVIAVDPDLVYSTRRAGAPITAFKRLLVRLLRQYHVELEAQQTRFNIALLAHVRDLERRVARLERPPDG